MSQNQTIPLPTPVPSHEWTAVYKEFEKVAYRIIDNPNLNTLPGAEAHIEKAVEALWAQHKGEPAWNEAYRRWCECHNEDEVEVEPIVEVNQQKLNDDELSLLFAYCARLASMVAPLSARQYYGFTFDSSVKDTFYGLAQMYAGEGVCHNAKEFKEDELYGPVLERMLNDIKRLLEE